MAEKVSKDSVNYRAAEGLKRCANCSMFRRQWWTGADGSCTLVAGDIQTEDTCDEWEPKKKEAA